MTPAQHEGAKLLADGILTLGEPGNFKDRARHERAMTPAQHEGAKLLADSILTLGEHMLVARVMPCMVFWELSCSAMGYAGHISNMVQNVEEIIERLPRDPKKVPLLLLR